MLNATNSVVRKSMQNMAATASPNALAVCCVATSPRVSYVAMPLEPSLSANVWRAAWRTAAHQGLRNCSLPRVAQRFTWYMSAVRMKLSLSGWTTRDFWLSYWGSGHRFSRHCAHAHAPPAHGIGKIWVGWPNVDTAVTPREDLRDCCCAWNIYSPPPRATIPSRRFLETWR